MTPDRLPVLVTLALALAALPATAQTQVWIRQLGTSDTDVTGAAVSDGAGGVYVGGSTRSSLGGPSAGQADAWLARYDSLGTQLWIRQLGTTADDDVGGAAEDAVGGLYVGGSTYASLGGPNAGQSDAWLARYDSLGTQLWIRQLGSSQLDGAGGFAPDGSGGVYVCGPTYGDLGGPSAGSWDAWLARYDSAGNRLWIDQLGTSEDEWVFDAAADGSGGVYLCGYVTTNLGGSYLDAWLAHYDGAGNQLWIRQLASAGIDVAYVVAADGSGGLYVGGSTSGDLGGPSAGFYDAWLARYDGAGSQLWVVQLGSNRSDGAYDAAPDGSGGVYLCGYTSGGLGGPSAGGYDAWLAHYDGAGNQLGIGQLGSSVDDIGLAAASDGSGRLYIAGQTEGNLGGPNAGKDDAWLARYEACPPPTSYCTAKVNSLGCTPSIGLSGWPSASAGSGCTVSASNLIGAKLGLFLHTTNGPAAIPLHNGLLCVASPFRRHPVQSTGGSAGACDGVLSEDINAYIASGADPLLVAGATLWIQTWSRDNADPFGDSLSDGLSAVICP